MPENFLLVLVLGVVKVLIWGFDRVYLNLREDVFG
jgi:hypothetical protein